VRVNLDSDGSFEDWKNNSIIEIDINVFYIFLIPFSNLIFRAKTTEFL